MTNRPTSAAAYRCLVDEGKLAKRQRETYQLVYWHGPGTSAEILRHELDGLNVLTQTRARFTELRDRGLLQEIDIRACKVTGHQAIVWEVTERVEPLKRDKRVGKMSEYRALVMTLEGWISQRDEKVAKWVREQINRIELIGL